MYKIPDVDCDYIDVTKGMDTNGDLSEQTETICGMKGYHIGEFWISCQSDGSGIIRKVEELKVILEWYLEDGSTYGHTICCM